MVDGLEGRKADMILRFALCNRTWCRLMFIWGNYDARLVAFSEYLKRLDMLFSLGESRYHHDHQRPR